MGEEWREAERQLLVFPWVRCCNTVILINIYLPGKVQRMIRLSVCVCARAFVYIPAPANLFARAYYATQRMNWVDFTLQGPNYCSAYTSKAFCVIVVCVHVCLYWVGCGGKRRGFHHTRKTQTAVLFYARQAPLT